VLYIGAEALDPKGTDQVISTMAAAQLLVTSFNSASSQAFTHLYFLTAYTVPVVIGFALWRSRTVPRWLAALLTAGLEIAEAQSAKGPSSSGSCFPSRSRWSCWRHASGGQQHLPMNHASPSSQLTHRSS
jgi:hypothetical protein